MTPTTKARKFGFASVSLLPLAGLLMLAITASGCVIDPGPNSNYGNGDGDPCYPDLVVGWQIQNSAGALVTCAGAGAATVNATVNGSAWPQACPPADASGSIDVPLAGRGSYDLTVSLFAADGTSLATPQEYSPPLQINNCTTSYTPSPAILVVSPPAP